jgi:predicted ATPase
MLRIKKITFKNFKGFESGFLDLKNLNFLIGANSSGKSSVLKLILLISQSLSSTSSQLFTLKGGLVDMGEKKNLYKDQNYSKEMEFSFEYHEPINTTAFSEQCVRAFRLKIRTDLRLLLEKSIQSDFVKNLLATTAAPSSIDSLIFCANFLAQNADNLTKEVDQDISEIEPPLNYKAVLDALLMCKNIVALEITRVVYTVRHNDEKDIPEIARIRLFSADECAFQLRLSTGRNLGNRVFLKETQQKRIEKYYSEIKNLVRFTSFQCRRKNTVSVGFNSINRAFLINPVGTLFCLLLEKATSPIALTFGAHRIRHVSPLRAYPKKYYIVDGDGLDERIDSENESERIVKLFQNDASLLKTVNEWLDLFGHKIEIQRIHESVYQILEISKQAKMEITNVGFGLSQILPVLVEPIVANQGDIVIVQQPEIHLHPKAQSILADYFIWVAKTRGITLFIETHSEYLLRRLRRRVAEAVAKLGSGEALILDESSILPSEVSILSVEKNKGNCEIEEIKLNEDGVFKWPKEFLENEIEDMVAYLNITSKVAAGQSGEVSK